MKRTKQRYVALALVVVLMMSVCMFGCAKEQSAPAEKPQSAQAPVQAEEKPPVEQAAQPEAQEPEAEEAAQPEPEAAPETQEAAETVAEPVSKAVPGPCPNCGEELDDVNGHLLQCTWHYSCNLYHLNSTSPLSAHDNCVHCGTPKCRNAHTMCPCGHRQCDGNPHGKGWCYKEPVWDDAGNAYSSVKEMMEALDKKKA